MTLPPFFLTATPKTSQTGTNAMLRFLQSYMFISRDLVTQSILHPRQESGGIPSSPTPPINKGFSHNMHKYVLRQDMDDCPQETIIYHDMHVGKSFRKLFVLLKILFYKLHTPINRLHPFYYSVEHQRRRDVLDIKTWR